MKAPTDGSPPEAAASPPGERLSSWKAIAAYVKRDVTTVQRWEKREGMPIHRHLHDRRGSVYAYKGELDEWFRQRRPQLEGEERPPGSLRQKRWLVGAGGTGVVAAALAVGWFLLEPKPADDPLRDAHIVPLTDFEGLEQGAAISRDGRFAAFVSDRDGQLDAWVTQIGTGEFRNLTQGAAPELLNPEVRSVGFTPDGSMITLWTRVSTPASGTPAINMWAVPTIGGALRPHRSGAVEMDWSSDGRRTVFHTTDPGDPIFVLGAGEREAVRIRVAERGVHCHFPTWSPDDRYIYFTQGIPPDEMDLWRMKPDGTEAEQLTFHGSRVLYPTFLDARTLLYLATTEDGAGPWLYALDVERKKSRRISFGVEQYTSLAASANRQKFVATVERAKTSLWRVAISDAVATDAQAQRLELPTVGGFSPRAGADYLLYVAPKGAGYGIWKLAGGAASELRSAERARIVGGAAISRDARQVAFVEESARGTRLYVMNAQTGDTRPLAESLEVRGAPAWSPDGASITVAAVDGNRQRLYKVPLDGTAPAAILEGHGTHPLWSPDGRLMIYSDADVGPTFVVKAASSDGKPHDLPSITLPRASKRMAFVPGSHALIVLEGEMRHVNFWYIDLETGQQRQLTDFGREFVIGDFDVTSDGEIVFDRRKDNSDIALIELPPA